MGSLVLHAGMIKAGSSSIQAWLAANHALLHREGIAVLVARHDRAGKLRLVEAGPGRVASNPIRRAYDEAPDKGAMLDALFELLESAAGRQHMAVVSSEALHGFFSEPVEPFLTQLEELARRHEVRVAYYVRPQHTALEAAWRQWGFRDDVPPSQFVAGHGEAFLDHFATHRRARELCPSVAFEPRPFRRDLLAGGDPASDFAERFLGVAPEGGTPPSWENRGLPLEVVNVLRAAPRGRFWSSRHDNSRFDRIRELLGSVEVEESEETRRSRLVLQAYCRERFEPGNRRLIAELGWDTDSFVFPLPEDAGPIDPDLRALDELWRPRASAAEREALYVALERALGAGAPDPLARPPGALPGRMRRAFRRVRR